MAHQYKSALLNASQNEIVNEVIDALENNHLTTGVAGWTSDDDYILTFTSGGGYLHTFILLNNKHIVAIHFEDGILEYSFDKFDTIEDYLSEENQDKEKGFGWEFMHPNHDSRIAELSEGGFTSFFKNVVNQKFENGGNVYVDKKYNITYSVEQRPDGRWTVYAESPNFEKNDQYAPSGLASKEDAIDLAMLSAGVRKEEDPESYFMRREFKNGGTTSSEYEIVEGYDHYKNIPLYRVTNRDEYVGEWHTDLRVAENERSELNDTQIYVYSDIDSDTGIIAEIQNNKFDNLEAAKEYARSKGYPIEIVELHYGQYKYGGGIDVNTYDFNKLAGKYVYIYSMGVSAPSESQIKSAKISSPNFRYRDLTLQFDLGNAIIPFENINQFLNNQVVDIKADKEDYAIQLIANQFAKGGSMYEDGGVIGQEIVFDDNGEENTGVIKDIHEITGDYIVSTDDGRTVLAQKEFDVISLGKMRKQPEAKKRFSFFEDGGNIQKENNEMLHSQAKEAKHHIEELHNILTTKTKVEPWVVAKMTRAKTDLSDITHYLDGNTSKMAKGGYVRPSYDIKTTGVYLFKTNEGEFYVMSYLFERENDTEDSLEIQSNLRAKYGSILIQNSAWKRLSSGKSVKAKTSRGDLIGTLTRVDDVKNSDKYIQGDYNQYDEEYDESPDYKIVEGFDFFRNKSLYQVTDGFDYVGQWHVNKSDAEKELSDLKSEFRKGGTLTSAQQNKFDKVMHEWKAGELHSGKNGPIVTNQDQAIAIAYSAARAKR